jgi:YD repeat-containing protein
MFDQPAGLPAGYFLRDGYTCTLRVAKDGEEELTQLCPALVVEARYRLKDGQGWGRVISFTDPDGRQHRLHVLERDLAARPQEVLAPLADKGFELPFGKAARDALLIRSWRPTWTLSSVSTFGWTARLARRGPTGPTGFP